MMYTADPQRSGGVTETPSAQVPTSSRLALFFVITFALTWVMFLPFILRVLRWGSDEAQLLQALGIAAPTMTAFVLTALATGRDGVRRLWRQGTRWRVGARWYVFVLALPAIAVGAALAVAALGGHAPPVSLSVEVVVAAVVVGLLAGLFEEFGWSGFAFPALQARYGALWAGVAMGVAVALWHLPFFFVPGTTQASTSFLIFLLGLIPARFLFGWLYIGTGGSVLLTILFHASGNAWSEILPVGPGAADTVGTVVFWVAAVAVLLVTRRPAPRPRSA